MEQQDLPAKSPPDYAVFLGSLKERIRVSFPTSIPQAEGEFLTTIPHLILARIPQVGG